MVQSGHVGLDCGHTAGVGGHLLGYHLYSFEKTQLPQALSLLSELYQIRVLHQCVVLLATTMVSAPVSRLFHEHMWIVSIITGVSQGRW